MMHCLITYVWLGLAGVDDDAPPRAEKVSVILSPSAELSWADRRRAKAFWASGGTLGGIALGLRVGVIVALATARKSAQQDGLVGALAGAAMVGPAVGMGIGAEILSITAIGLAAGGGVALGRADARDDIQLRVREELRSRQVAGGALLGVGLAVGLSASLLPVVVVPSSGWSAAELAGLQVGAHGGWMLAAAGAGLVAHARSYERTQRALVGPRFRPTIGRTYVGVSMSGRF